MTLRYARLWTDFQGAGGSVIGHVPGSHFEELITTDRVSRDDDGRVVLSAAAPAADLIRDGTATVLQIKSDYGTRDYRIHVLDDASDSDRLVAQLRTPLYELQYAGVCAETTANVVSVDLEWKALSPSAIVAKILAFCPAWWSAGTITPTIAVDLSPSGWNPLRAFRELVAAIRAQGVACELDFARTEPTGYHTISLVTAIGSSASTLDVRTGKNLMRTQRTRDRERYALAVAPAGSGTPRATIGKAWFEVTAKSGTTLTVQQPVTGGAVIGFDGQLDGQYLVDDAGARQVISNSDTSAQQFDVASAANVTAGRWYRFAENSSGDEMVVLPIAPATVTPLHIVESSTLDATTNFVGNPAMRTWTGASTDPPDGWTKTGTPILAQTTTAGLWVYGGQSCRIQNATTFTSPLIRTYVPAWAASVTWSLWIYLSSVSSGTQTVKFLRDGSVRSTVDITTGYALSTWHRIDFTESLSGLTGAVRYFECQYVSILNGFVVYVDAAQVSFTASAQAFVEGSNPAKLWALGNRYLAQYGTIPVSYDASFADLNAIDATGFPYDAVELGQSARVTDTRLAVTTSARIQELARDWRKPDASRLTIANRPDDLVALQTGILQAA